MPAGFGEIEPGLRVQFESKIEGLLSGDTHVTGNPGWHSESVGSYRHFEITELGPHGQGFKATAHVYFPDRVGVLYLRTDSTADRIIELSALGFPLPGTGDDQPKEVPVDPGGDEPEPGPGTD